MTAAQTTIKMSQTSFNNNNVINVDDKAEYKILPYSVTRKVLKQDELEEISGYDRHKDTAKDNLLGGIRNLDFKTILQDVCPVVKWLPEYSVEKNLTGDIISGITGETSIFVRLRRHDSTFSSTVAVMHIPQGMAYGLLAGVEPIVGLYMAFFPTLIYFLFGTSRHISMGTFAVISLMTSKIVATYSDPNHGLVPAAGNLTVTESDLENSYTYTPFEVSCTAIVCRLIRKIIIAGCDRSHYDDWDLSVDHVRHEAWSAFVSPLRSSR